MDRSDVLKVLRAVASGKLKPYSKNKTLSEESSFETILTRWQSSKGKIYKIAFYVKLMGTVERLELIVTPSDDEWHHPSKRDNEWNPWNMLEEDEKETIDNILRENQDGKFRKIKEGFVILDEKNQIVGGLFYTDRRKAYKNLNQ